jgi:hypothetical protein
MIVAVGVLIAAATLVAPATPTLEASPLLRDGSTRNGRDVGRLALLFGDAGVDRAVELVFL